MAVTSVINKTKKLKNIANNNHKTIVTKILNDRANLITGNHEL